MWKFVEMTCGKAKILVFVEAMKWDWGWIEGLLCYSFNAIPGTSFLISQSLVRFSRSALFGFWRILLTTSFSSVNLLLLGMEVQPTFTVHPGQQQCGLLSRAHEAHNHHPTTIINHRRSTQKIIILSASRQPHQHPIIAFLSLPSGHQIALMTIGRSVFFGNDPQNKTSVHNFVDSHDPLLIYFLLRQIVVQGSSGLHARSTSVPTITYISRSLHIKPSSWIE